MAGKSRRPDGDRRATVRDVASLANVSIGTVSRVVTGKARVSDELSERVLAAAEELSFRPRARSPGVQAPVRLVSFFVSDIANLLFGSVVSAAEERLAQLGFTLVVANTRNESLREAELLSLLRERTVEGAIISFGEESRPGLGAELRRIGLPVVVLDRVPPKGIDAVLVDHRRGTSDAADYLIGLGHRRIGLLTASGQIRPGMERIAGLRDAYAAAGLDFRDCTIRTDCGTANAAFAETMTMLAGPERPTALMTLGSEALSGMLRAVKARGLSIPDDLSVVCFGDTELAKVVEPAITCVHWDRWHLGRLAVELLVRRIANRMTAEPRTAIVPTEIILRQSCAAPKGP